MPVNAIVAGSTFGALIGDAAADYALIMRGQRSIGDLFPHVVVEEVHNDELAITQHPVEFGAPVTDHAFPQPYTVEIRCGWSDSTAQSSGYVQAVYQALLALQGSRTPFAISTGKRQYTSMLLRTLTVKTDPESEYALMCIATAQHIVITSTQGGAAATPANTDGSSVVGSVGANPTGPPSFPAGSVPFDELGNVTFPNDVTGVGTVNPTSTAYSP